MKIAFLIRSMVRAGAERQLVLLATGMRRAGHQVSVHVFYGGGDLESELRENGIPVNDLGKTGRWDSVGFLLRTIKRLRAERADVIHAYMSGANIVVAVLKKWLQPAKVVWGVRASRRLFEEYDWAYRASARAEIALAKAADLVISNSNAGLTHAVEQGFPPERTVFVPNGLDPAAFFVDRAARDRTRAQWNVRADDILIGRVGRLDPMKDYPGFLKAAALIKKSDPRLKFVCIGTGPAPYLKYLQDYATGLGIGDSIRWTGLLQNMRDAYNAIDLLASSSAFGEGFPNVLLEAMACGVPCVTTDVGDARQIVQGTGLVVPVCDTTVLGNAFAELLRNRPAPEIVRERVVSEYSVDLLVSRTEEHLRRLVVDSGKEYPCVA